MNDQTVSQMQALVISIGEIGKPKEELEFVSKRIVEKLKKSRAELIQEAFSDAFEPNQT